ncbi:MAG: hypothetical protein HQ582_07875 [Planctomycetes bacterium]|nr:hypothetical protein [Planctomycetota bacterium]
MNIAIASPGDVAAERDAVPKVFNRWNSANADAILHPVMWESASVPSLGDHPQHILNQSIIDESDLLAAILWTRLGTPTPSARSGTVEEIREFIRQKGPKRVMLYFCTRNLPYDIDSAEFARLREFKAEMQSQGLYCEYASVGEFERDLYRHLDVKVAELVSGKLPIPAATVDNHIDEEPTAKQHVDPRFRQLIDFGSTFTEIGSGFAKRMDEFDAFDGGVPDKFLDLGAHVYTSVATCLDRALAYSTVKVSPENRMVLENLSTRLKQLAAASHDYLKKPFPQYWKDGRKISDDLSAHVAHLSRLPLA